MPEPTHNPSKVTLENLLRLKRHERPGPEFWARFDRELQERSMRELMEPAPSHWRWLEVLLGRRMAWMTTGATAALVMSFVWHGTVNRSFAPDARPAIAEAPHFASTVNSASPAPSINQVTVVAANDSAANAQPKFVVASLSQSPQPSNIPQVPATLALAAGASNNVRYTAYSLVDAALTSRMNQSAY